MKQVTRIEMSFENEEIEQLWNIKCKSFIEDEKGRFDYFFGSNEAKLSELYLINKECSIMLFTDDFLKAKIVYSFYRANGIAASILIDKNDDPDSWVIWAERDI